MLEEALARRLAAVLQERLPRSWQTISRERERLGPIVADGVIDIVAPDGRDVWLLLEVKARIEPKDVPAALAQARQYAKLLSESGKPAKDIAIVVGSAYLSPRARELLAEADAGYVDLTGNLRISADNPPFFIELPGHDTNPWSEDRPLRSLRGPAAGRVVRGLCDFRPPYAIQELATRAQTPIATVSRVVDLLDREALLTREYRGGVTDVRSTDLIRRWTKDYSFTKSNTVSSYLEPRGLPVLLDKLPKLGVRYAITGSQAAIDLAPVAAPRLAMVFVDAPADGAAGGLGLRRAETGANVLLAMPYDTVVFDRTRSRNGLVCAAPSQAAADLLTGPGRLPAEGEALLEWMREHEDAWRA
jgi:hypothetical protein